MASTERIVSRAISSGAPLGNCGVTFLPCLGPSGNVYDRARQMPMKCDEIRDYGCSKPLGALERTSDYESGGQEFESLRARHSRCKVKITSRRKHCGLMSSHPHPLKLDGKRVQPARAVVGDDDRLREHAAGF